MEDETKKNSFCAPDRRILTLKKLGMEGHEGREITSKKISVKLRL